LPQANWVRTVHHGLPQDLLQPKPVKPTYFAFLGRIAPEKGVDRAIRIAQHCGMPFKVAAKVDNVDREYFEEQILPMIKSAKVDTPGPPLPDFRAPGFSHCVGCNTLSCVASANGRSVEYAKSVLISSQKNDLDQKLHEAAVPRISCEEPGFTAIFLRGRRFAQGLVPHALCEGSESCLSRLSLLSLPS
jgi:hypothetical protein